MVKMKRLLFISIFILCVCACNGEGPIHESEKGESVDRPYRLTVDGKPFLMLGAQLRTDFFRQLDGRELDQLDDYFSLAA